MVKKKPKIQWTDQAKASLKSVYDFYKHKSLQGAKNVRDDIYKSPETILFAKQYQVDEYNPDCRRIVVRDYKVLYRETENTIYIVDVICTLQDPPEI